MEQIAQGKRDTTALYQRYAWNRKFCSQAVYRVLYTANYGDYLDAASGKPVSIDAQTVLPMEPWGRRVPVRKP